MTPAELPAWGSSPIPPIRIYLVNPVDNRVAWGDNEPMTTTPTTTYTITVPGFATWATGTIRGSANRSFTVTEDATIIGGMHAIDAAVDQARRVLGAWVVADDYSPTIDPNPALLGWPIA